MVFAWPIPSGEPLPLKPDEKWKFDKAGKLPWGSVKPAQEAFADSKGLRLIALNSTGRVAALRREAEDASPTPVEIWDVEAGTRLGEVRGAAVRRGAAVFSMDGSRLAFESATRPGAIEVWDRATGAITRLAEGLESGPCVGTISPNNRLLTAFAENSFTSVELWDIDAQARLAAMDFPPPFFGWPGGPRFGPPTVWSNDGRFLAALSADATRGVQVWEVVYANSTSVVRRRVDALTFSPDGGQLAVNGAVWGVCRFGAQVILRPTAEKSVGDFIVFARPDQTWAVHLPAEPSADPVKVVQLAPAKREFTLPRAAYQWGQPNEAKKEPSAQVVALGLSPSGKRFCVAYGASFVHVGNAQPQIELWDLEGQDPQLVWRNPFDFSLDAQRFPVLLQFRSKNHSTRGVFRVSFSPDETRVAVVGDEFLAAYEAATGKLTQYGNADARFVFSPSWERVVTGSNSGEINVYQGPNEGREGDQSRPAHSWSKRNAHQGAVLALAMDPTEHLLASAGEDRKIHLWELATGREAAAWPAHDRPVTALAFSPDGRLLVSAGLDGAVKVWNLPFIDNELTALGLAWDFGPTKPWNAAAPPDKGKD
jgi:WD40 repeat protein